MNELITIGNELFIKAKDGLQVDMHIIFISMLVVGLLLNFFGLKLLRVLGFIMGASIGGMVGAAVGLAAGLEGAVFAGVIAAAALIFGVLSAVFIKIGVFLIIWWNVASICISLIGTQSFAGPVVGIAAGLVMAILAMKYRTIIVIVVTSIAGGLLAGISIGGLLEFTENIFVCYGLGFAIAVIGMVVQFMMHSRKMGKKEKIFSDKVKEEVSMESEVEKARMMLDDEFEDQEDDSDDKKEDDIVIMDDM